MTRAVCHALAAAAALLALPGCHTPECLVQPPDVPVFVKSYAALEGTRGLRCALNLVNCPPEAALAKVKMSGRRVPESRFPVRDVIRAELEAAVRENFATVVPGAQPHVELKAETRRVILERDGDDLTFQLALAVKLLNPRHEDKPYFSKLYALRTAGPRANADYVPPCVYEAVQHIVMDFMRDVAGDSSLVARLSELKNER